MAGTLLVLVLVVLFSLQTLFGRLFSTNYPGRFELTPHIYSVISGFSVAFLTLLIGGFKFSASTLTIGFGLIEGLILFGYNIYLIKAADKGPYSMVVISMIFGHIVVAMASSLIFFDGHLSILQYLSIGIILISFVFLNIEGIKEKKMLPKFFLYCAALFAFNGLYGAMMDAQQTLHSGGERLEMIIITYFTAALLGLISLIARRGSGFIEDFRLNKKSALFIVLVALVQTGAHNLMLFGLSIMNVAVLYTLNNGGVLLISVLYSIIIFKEKPTVYKSIGIVLSLIGMITLSL